MSPPHVTVSAVARGERSRHSSPLANPAYTLTSLSAAAVEVELDDGAAPAQAEPSQMPPPPPPLPLERLVKPPQLADEPSPTFSQSRPTPVHTPNDKETEAAEGNGEN